MKRQASPGKIKKANVVTQRSHNTQRVVCCAEEVFVIKKRCLTNCAHRAASLVGVITWLLLDLSARRARRTMSASAAAAAAN